jgi:hypothetical protein
MSSVLVVFQIQIQKMVGEADGAGTGGRGRVEAGHAGWDLEASVDGSRRVTSRPPGPCRRVLGGHSLALKVKASRTVRCRPECW